MQKVECRMKNCAVRLNSHPSAFAALRYGRKNVLRREAENNPVVTVYLAAAGDGRGPVQRGEFFRYTARR